MPQDWPEFQVYDSDFEGWEASDTPEESWSQYENSDEDGQWPVESVVGQELDSTGVPRYQVKWKNWERENGTSTTWERDISGDNNILENWTRVEMKRKERLAPESEEAYEEKLARWRRNPSPALDWDNDIEAEKTRRRLGQSRFGVKSATRGRKVSKQALRSRSPSLGSERPIKSRQLRQRSTSQKDLRAETPSIAPPPSTLQRSDSISNTNNLSRLLRTRATLEGEWNAATRKARAASVLICNDKDDEEYPPVDGYFEYRESRCIRGNGVPRASETDSFLVGCACEDNCGNLASCSCRTYLDPGVEGHEDEEGIVTYDEKGLFLFNHQGREVVECNKMCSCDKFECRNRVAQRPRDVPIEIFKTPDNGWGARATEDLPKGKFIGLYTGKILLRDEADQIPPDEKNYIFDLDTRDADDTVKVYYSIDATTCGNWTRFVNHSCDPVAEVYSVVFDTCLESNMPQIAFVTSQFLPAGREITIDYNPSAPKGSSRAKGKQKVDAHLKPCLCGALMCRGWV